MKKNSVSLCVYGILFVCILYFLFMLYTGVTIGLSKYANNFLNIINYSFFHGNGIHLILNMATLLSLNKIFMNKLKLSNFIMLTVFSFLFVTLVLSFFSEHSVIGFSGILCGYLGYWTCIDFFENKSINGILEVIIIVWFTFLIPNISILGHIAGLIAGLCFWIIQFLTVKVRKANEKIV